jgi:hypothetical protein
MKSDSPQHLDPEDEDCYRLGYDAVQSGRTLQVLWRNSIFMVEISALKIEAKGSFEILVRL